MSTKSKRRGGEKVAFNINLQSLKERRERGGGDIGGYSVGLPLARKGGEIVSLPF